MNLNNVVDICNSLLQYLQSDCKDMNFVSAYPTEINDFPIKKPTVSVTIKTIDLPYSEGMYLGKDLENYYYGVTAECDIALNICVPKSMSGIDCYDAFNKVADSCLSVKNMIIKNLYCEKITYDRILGALVLSAGVKLSAQLTTKKS